MKKKNWIAGTIILLILAVVLTAIFLWSKDEGLVEDRKLETGEVPILADEILEDEDEDTDEDSKDKTENTDMDETTEQENEKQEQGQEPEREKEDNEAIEMPFVPYE